MHRTREFSKAETMLMDSEWMLEHPTGENSSGKFPIEFRADGFNHCEPLRALRAARHTTASKLPLSAAAAAAAAAVR